MGFTKFDLEEAWERGTGLPSEGPLHQAIINEVLDATEGEEMTAENVGSALQSIVEDCERFAQALTANGHRPVAV